MKHVIYALLAVTALGFPLTQAMAQNAGSSSHSSIGSVGVGSVSNTDGSVGASSSASGTLGGNTTSGTTASGTVYSTSNMSADTIRSIQRSLNDRGYRVGRIDGVWNTNTAAEFRRFEQSQGLNASAGTNLNTHTLQNLGIGLDNVSPAAGQIGAQVGGQINGNVNTSVTGSSSR